MKTIYIGIALFIITFIFTFIFDYIVAVKIVKEKENEIYRKGHSDGYDKGYDDCIDNIKVFGYDKIVGNESITMDEFLEKINSAEENDESNDDK